MLQCALILGQLMIFPSCACDQNLHQAPEYVADCRRRYESNLWILSVTHVIMLARIRWGCIDLLNTAQRKNTYTCMYHRSHSVSSQDFWPQTNADRNWAPGVNLRYRSKPPLSYECSNPGPQRFSTVPVRQPYMAGGRGKGVDAMGYSWLLHLSALQKNFKETTAS